MTLASLLESKQEHLATLTALLQQEQELLVQSRPEGELLKQIAADKEHHFNVLEELESQRRDTQQQMGFGDAPQDAEHAANGAGCLPLWQSVLTLARQAAQLNHLNGILVQQSLEHNQRALNILQELTGSFVYGANGKPCTTRNKINSAV